ncbi:phosphotransferase [Nocardiopsis ansamitocini]|uniref:phosphotransferase n=1 Tax=Nocardiopsis ansamitocini TaxID=1670832 RepID=UPI0025573376|nr:phosphotransferase [Nocardiopsis ansamitocini]
MAQSAHDELIRRDPGIPGLGVLLDPTAVLDAVHALLPRGVERPSAARAAYLHYQPGVRLTAGLVLDYPSGPEWAFARAFSAGDSGTRIAEEADYARRWAPQPGAHSVDVNALVDPRLRGPLNDPATGVVMGPPVDDRSVPAARHFASSPHGFAAGPGSSVHTLAYQPGRRWVGRVDDAWHTPRHVVRAYAGSVNVAAYLALAAAGLPVPDLVRVSRYGLLALSWTPGEPLDRVTGEREEALREAGGLLARIHAVTPPRELSRSDASGAPVAAATVLAGILPGLAARAEAVARRCGEALRSLAAPQVLSHGDFRAEQVVRGEQGLALVDLDRVRMAHPASDLADFAAADYLHGRAMGTDPTATLGPLLAGYVDESTPDLALAVRRGLGVFTAASLLRRAGEPFCTGAPNWDTRAESMVGLAEELLAAD